MVVRNIKKDGQARERVQELESIYEQVQIVRANAQEIMGPLTTFVQSHKGAENLNIRALSNFIEHTRMASAHLQIFADSLQVVSAAEEQDLKEIQQFLGPLQMLADKCDALEKRMVASRLSRYLYLARRLGTRELFLSIQSAFNQINNVLRSRRRASSLLLDDLREEAHSADF